MLIGLNSVQWLLRLDRAEIGGDHLRIVLNLGRRALGDRHAMIEHRDLLADVHHEIHVVLDQQNCQSETLPDFADRFGQLRFSRRVHAGRRLVEQQHLRLGRQRPDDFQVPLMAVAQASRQSVRPVASSNRSSSSRQRSRIAASSRRCCGERSTVFAKRGRARNCPARQTLSSTLRSGNKRMFWKRAGDSGRSDLVRLAAGEDWSAKRTSTAVRPIDAGEQIEHGRLAGTVGTDQSV